MTSTELGDKASSNASYGRLKWRCRRGVKELDLVLQRYLATHYETAEPQEQEMFLRILDCPDPDLLAWIYGLRKPPEQFSKIINKLSAKRAR